MVNYWIFGMGIMLGRNLVCIPAFVRDWDSLWNSLHFHSDYCLHCAVVWTTINSIPSSWVCQGLFCSCFPFCSSNGVLYSFSKSYVHLSALRFSQDHFEVILTVIREHMQLYDKKILVHSRFLIFPTSIYNIWTLTTFYGATYHLF